MKLLFYARAFHKSLYDPRWISANNGNIRAVTYFLLLILLLSAVQSAVMTYGFSREIAAITTQLKEKASSMDLTIANDLFVVSGAEQPFGMPLAISSGDVYLYVNTTVSSTAVDVLNIADAKDKELVVIASDVISIYSKEHKGSITLSPGDVGNARIFEQLKRRIPLLATDVGSQVSFFFIGLLPLFLLQTVSYFLYVFVGTTAVWMVVKIKGLPQTYGTLVSAAFFAVTWPIIIDIIGSIFAIHIPLVGTAIFLSLLSLSCLTPKEKKPIMPAHLEKE